MIIWQLELSTYVKDLDPFALTRRASRKAHRELLYLYELSGGRGGIDRVELS